MELKSFRVKNFRSINDSGDIDVTRITALLGRNESGKSNILRALHSLNPADGFKKLSPIKDFPRHKKLSECHDRTQVVTSTWRLTAYEQQSLASIWPAAEGVTEVTVTRRYDNVRTVDIEVSDKVFDISAIKSEARKIDAAVKAKAAALAEDAKVGLESASNAFVAAVGIGETATKWAENASATLASLRQALAAADIELTDVQDQTIVALEELAEAIPQNEENRKKARDWVIERLPRFMYLEDYPEIRAVFDR